MRETNILISGASIAGPALAYWLRDYGYTVTVIEKAPGLRPGGQAVDVKGATHLAVLERMGLLGDVHRMRTGGTDLVIVDRYDRELATIPAEFTGGDIEILRGDLARLLYERTAGSCEYVFGDSITALTETADGVHVDFEHATARTFDLVIGADGIHSVVRRLAFGPEERFVRFLGYYYAVAGTSTDRNAERNETRARGRMYNEPGRLVSLDGPDDTGGFFVFASEQLEYDRYEVEQQKRIVADIYAGTGWRTPRVLDDMWRAPDFYMDSISRVSIGAYTTGRVALVGDAAYGNTLGGFGTGLALVGAYVLAGELAAADGDHRIAYPRYTDQLRGYARIARKSNAGPFLAPRTRTRIRMRNWMFKSSLLLGLLLKLTDNYATNIELPDYKQDRAV